jgi:hypothetical protein
VLLPSDWVATASELVGVAVTAGLRVRYIVGDTHYSAGWFTKRLARLGLTWHGPLDPKTIVVWRGERQAVRDLAQQLHLRWRQHLGLRARTLRVYAPKYGHLRLVVTRNRHGNYEYLVSNDLVCDLTTMVVRKRSRWSVETIFRDSKQFAGLEACQLARVYRWLLLTRILHYFKAREHGANDDRTNISTSLGDYCRQRAVHHGWPCWASPIAVRPTPTPHVFTLHSCCLSPALVPM